MPFGHLGDGIKKATLFLDCLHSMSDTLRVSNIHFGNVASNYNQPQMGFTSVGIGSTTNYGFLQFFGTPNTLCWTANGTVGIGTTAPLAKLQCCIILLSLFSKLAKYETPLHINNVSKFNV